MVRLYYIWKLLSGTSFLSNYHSSGQLITWNDLMDKHVTREFALPANPAVLYKIELFEDSIATLAIKQGDNWKLLDVLDSHLSFWNSFGNSIMIPDVHLDDFNHDGFLDLDIWIRTNVNGNRWMKLFLYNAQTGRLEKLPNTPEGSNIWDAPEYTPGDSIITCQRMSGVYGTSFISKYKLNGLVATPVSKKENSMEGMVSVTKAFVGWNSRWKLVKKTYNGKGDN